MEATDPNEIRRLVNKIFDAFDSDSNNHWSFDEMSEMISQFLNH